MLRLIIVRGKMKYKLKKFSRDVWKLVVIRALYNTRLVKLALSYWERLKDLTFPDNWPIGGPGWAALNGSGRNRLRQRNRPGKLGKTGEKTGNLLNANHSTRTLTQSR